jgi:hypothetical protein
MAVLHPHLHPVECVPLLHRASPLPCLPYRLGRQASRERRKKLMQVSIFRPFKVLNKVATNWYILIILLIILMGNFMKTKKRVRERLLKTLEETKGAWKDENHPELRTARDVERYVREKRQSYRKRFPLQTP